MIHISDCEQKTDAELVSLSLKNQDYYYCLMKRYEAPLMNYIYKLSGLNRTDLEDILQEVFILVYQNLNDYNKSFKFSSWIYRIAHNYTVSQLRKKAQGTQNISWDEHDLEQIVQSDFDLEENLALKINYHNLLSIIDSLPLKYKEVLLLKFVDGKDYQEISDILRKPIGTVGTLINRAKKMLAQEIEKYKAGVEND
ncbi:MAG: RNA polymerase sigma factor [Atribacterota bacterium]|nr:RNA polymerase sigma factor [Atribacterota bacterium]MDD5497657.1 RNA polymerase sigma factor [Atribacterota bacterium]